MAFAPAAFPFWEGFRMAGISRSLPTSLHSSQHQKFICPLRHQEVSNSWNCWGWIVQPEDASESHWLVAQFLIRRRGRAAFLEFKTPHRSSSTDENQRGKVQPKEAGAAPRASLHQEGRIHPFSGPDGLDAICRDTKR